MIQRLRRFYWSLAWFDSLTFSTGGNMFYCYKESGLFRFAFNTFFKRTKAQVHFMGLYWPNIPIKGIYILIVYSQFDICVKPSHELLSPIIIIYYCSIFDISVQIQTNQASRLVTHTSLNVMSRNVFSFSFN